MILICVDIEIRIYGGGSLLIRVIYINKEISCAIVKEWIMFLYGNGISVGWYQCLY